LGRFITIFNFICQEIRSFLGAIAFYTIIPVPIAWPDFGRGGSALVNEAWSALMHFADDGDIHKTDADYLKSERQKLDGCAARLRTRLGASGD
jgi:hypothetical protein